jgi:hypothetical protein
MYTEQYMKISVLLFTATAMIFLFFFSGCAAKDPSEVDAQKVFGNKWAWHINNGNLEILSFKKVKGHVAEKVGVQFYTIEYVAEIKAVNLKLTDWQRLRLEGSVEKQKDIPDGEILKLWGQVSFAKTKKGWKGEDGEIY